MTLLWKVVIILRLVEESQHSHHPSTLSVSRMKLFCFGEYDLTHDVPKHHKILQQKDSFQMCYMMFFFVPFSVAGHKSET